MDVAVVLTCVGVGVLCLIIGMVCGAAVVMFMVAKDKTVVRLREGEVVMQKQELDAMIKQISASRKREILES